MAGSWSACLESVETCWVCSATVCWGQAYLEQGDLAPKDVIPRLAAHRHRMVDHHRHHPAVRSQRRSKVPSLRVQQPPKTFQPTAKGCVSCGPASDVLPCEFVVRDTRRATAAPSSLSTHHRPHRIGGINQSSGLGVACNRKLYALDHAVDHVLHRGLVLHRRVVGGDRSPRVFPNVRSVVSGVDIGRCRLKSAHLIFPPNVQHALQVQLSFVASRPSPMQNAHRWSGNVLAL